MGKKRMGYRWLVKYRESKKVVEIGVGRVCVDTTPYVQIAIKLQILLRAAAEAAVVFAEQWIKGFQHWFIREEIIAHLFSFLKMYS